MHSFNLPGASNFDSETAAAVTYWISTAFDGLFKPRWLLLGCDDDVGETNSLSLEEVRFISVDKSLLLLASDPSFRGCPLCCC